MGALDPSFTLSSDFYYRSLLSKVDFLDSICIDHLLPQIYDKGKATVKQYLDTDSPQYASLALDGWSVHHHGFMGAISSNCRNKMADFDITLSNLRLHQL